MIITVPLSIVAGMYLSRRIDIDLNCAEKDIIKNTESYVGIIIKNPTYLMTMNVKVLLEAENEFYNSKNTLEIALPCRIHGNYEMMLPVNLSRCGIVNYSVKKIYVLDLVGFIEYKKNVDVKRSVNVFPEAETEYRQKAGEVGGGKTETDETNKKGHDFSDVSDVREYIPGDRLNSIHWKLSAKKDDLMVKDRVSMSDEQMVVLVDLAGDNEVVDEVLSLGYNVVDSLVNDGIFVKLMWWKEKEFEFETRKILYREDLKEAYTDMYEADIYESNDKISEYISGVMPELRAYVRICYKEGKVDAVVEETI
ncbi:MAG: DUF58 domain-containing protein [Lachnospiraceae bacterium]|nr:DUF58 domain-containing protein [Lachnospiraceae bacterium]